MRDNMATGMLTVAKATAKSSKAGVKDAHKKVIIHVTLIFIGVPVAIAAAQTPLLGLWAYPINAIPSVVIEIVDMIHRW